MFEQKMEKLGASAVPQAEPDQLGGRPKKKAALEKIAILRNEGKLGGRGRIPKSLAAGEPRVDQAGQLWREVLVKEQLHFAPTITRRSRSAAKDRQA
jgi:hypothetical protein